MPIRIQRKRSKGWRKPPGAIIVTRGTLWGNPYKIDDHTTRKQSLDFFRHHLKVMKEKSPYAFENYIAPLRGKDLACFCAPEEACHADILLQLAQEVPHG